jgi:hypothetical protein
MNDPKLQSILKLQPFSHMNNIILTMNKFTVCYNDIKNDPVMYFSMGRPAASNVTIQVILPPGEESEICFFSMPDNYQSNHMSNAYGSNQVFLFSLTVLCYMEHFNSYASKCRNLFCVPKVIMHNIDTLARGKKRNGVIYKSDIQFLELLGFLRTHERGNRGEKSTLTDSLIYRLKPMSMFSKKK